MNLEAAIQFVQARDNPVELDRLRHVLTGEPVPEAAEALLAEQRADGSWAPFWAPAYSGLDATCFRLAQAETLGLDPGHPAVARAVEMLAHRQQADGSWEEDALLAEAAPPWARPGDLGARLYLTANCGYWLARLSQPVAPPPAAGAIRAGYFLAARQAPDGSLPSFRHTHWLAGGLWRLAGEAEPAERVLTHLAPQLPAMPADHLAWMITCLRGAGLPAGHALLRGACERLGGLQRADGAWPSEDGPAWDGHTTLEALRALHLCGALPRPGH
jgi:hypothetical protein